MAQYIAVRALSRAVNIRVRSAFNEIQSVKIDATAGQFKLVYGGQTTADIAFNAAASAVQSALVALSNIDPGDVYVTGGPGNSGGTTPYVVSFGGALGTGDVAQLTSAAGTTPLSGGGAAATITTSKGGATGGAPVKLSATVDTIIDLDQADNRRALADHASLGQFIVTATNPFDGTVALPTNS